MNSFHRDNHPVLPILLLFLFSLVGLLLFMLLGGVVVYLVTDSVSINAALSASHTTSEGLMSIRVLQVFQTIGIFIFPSVLAAFLSSDSARSFLGFYSTNTKLCLLSSMFMLIAVPGINLIASLNAQIPLPEWMIAMEQKASDITEALLVVNRFDIFLFNILMVAILPAIGEELFFRGSLQPLVSRLVKSNFWGIFITSALFSAIHFQFQGFIPRFLLGMIFGYLFVWSRSIWVPIVVHFANNALATIIYYLIGMGVIPFSSEKVGEVGQYWQMGVISLFLSSAILVIIWKYSKRNLEVNFHHTATE